MKPNQLAEIKQRIHCPSAKQAVQIGEYEACARAIVERDAAALVAEVERLQAAVDAVRELHRRDDDSCETCSHPGAIQTWPCPTVRALDGKLGGEE